MIENVRIVGGTHGNELSGIMLLRKWQKSPPGPFDFQLQLTLANPQATAACRRYIDQDLNRSFSQAELSAEASNYERQRARELKAELEASDFLLDLHNTTSQMGRCLILSRQNALQDPITRSLCLSLSQNHEDVRVYLLPRPPEQNPYLPSMAQRDITVEVGPLAHGTLNAECYFATESLIEEMLAFLQSTRQADWLPLRGDLEVFEHLHNVDYPRDADGNLSAMLHPDVEGQDFHRLDPGAPLFIDLDGNTIHYSGQEPVWPVFINEQAYYEKHFAMSFTRRRILSFR